MLSKHERRQLDLIEQGLREDSDWQDPQERAGGVWRRPWVVRCLVGFAVLLMVIGVLTSTGELLVQGLLIVGALGGWWSWQRIRTAESR